MNITDIDFPHLGLYLHNVPQYFTVFGFRIYLYAIFIAGGMAAGFYAALQIAKKTGQDPELYWDFTFRAIIVSIICARIYYVIFRWDDFKGDILSILNLRTGGLAIYGGVIGAFLTIYFFSKRRQCDPFVLGDTGVCGLILGQAIGRWGNFTNREVFGGYTDSLFAMRLPVDAVRPWDITEELRAAMGAGDNFIQVHPTFLYESAWNLLIFVLLLLLWKHKKFNGEVILLYLGGYGLGRALIEGIRTDTLLIPGTALRVSQVLAILLVVFSVVTDLIVRFRKKEEPLPDIEDDTKGKEHS